MASDAALQQAREHHRAAEAAAAVAQQRRAQRDAAVRKAYAEGGRSYRAIARAVGCSEELIAYIVRGGRLPTPRPPR